MLGKFFLLHFQSVMSYFSFVLADEAPPHCSISGKHVHILCVCVCVFKVTNYSSYLCLLMIFNRFVHSNIIYPQMVLILK